MVSCTVGVVVHIIFAVRYWTVFVNFLLNSFTALTLLQTSVARYNLLKGECMLKLLHCSALFMSL